jgi:hypothetical protein
MAERIERWRTALAGGARVVIPDGLRLTLPADRAEVIAGLAAAEVFG